MPLISQPFIDSISNIFNEPCSICAQQKLSNCQSVFVSVEYISARPPPPDKYYFPCPVVETSWVMTLKRV